MALMMGSLYQALRSADVDEEAARKAAEEVAAYDDHFSDVDRNFAEVRRDITRLDRRMNLLQWMMGFNLAATTAILIRLFLA